MAIDRVTFEPSPTCKRFMLSNARRRLIRGPFRSGKSVACCMEIARRAAQQAPGPDGIRRSRWAVVRNTQKQLNDTTIKTWMDWIPPGVAGTWGSVAKTFTLRYSDIHAEVMFRALDDPSDLANLLSLELTGAYINEAREIHREIVEGLDGRIGQYPRRDRGGCTWAGIIADTNPPTEGSYWYFICEKIHPDTLEPTDSWDVFTQPSGLSPQAENVEHLPDNYYRDLMVDKTEEYVRVYIKNEYAKTRGGKPVHPLFDESLHVAREPLIAIPTIPLTLAADFGRTPAIAFLQMDMFSRLIVLDEIVTEGMSLDTALKQFAKPLIKNRFQDFDLRVTGDPSGEHGVQTDEATCVSIFRRNGFKRIKFPKDKSNNPIKRQGALDGFLRRRPDAGGILIDPRCKILIRGLGGGYHFKVNRQGVTSDEPEKNIFSHICEALQYGAMFYEEPPKAEEYDRQAIRIAQAQRTMAQFANTYSLRR